MNTLTTKATILATLVTTATLMTAPAKADQLVSLERAVELIVAQQSQAVTNDVNRLVLSSIHENIADFNMNALYQLDYISPNVTITDIAQNTMNESSEKPTEYSPK